VNIQSAFKLGEARAMVMLAAAHRGLELFEYTPTDVKLSIAGYGRADKRQVKEMVHRTLGAGVPDDLAEDATDALAISLCHIFRAKMPRPSTVRKAFPRPARANAIAGAKL
jgi:crossover junction endodeoxyribonuclease RuvC